MTRLPITKKIQLVTVFILQLKMMQNMYHVLLFVIVALVCRKHKNRGILSYAHERLHRHNIRTLNLDKMLFESDRQNMDNCRMDRELLQGCVIC